MALRYSDEAIKLMADDIGLRRAINGSHIVLFTGTQPVSANSSSGSSQPIISFTQDDGVYVAETRPVWQVTFSAILAETTISSVTIGGIELLSSSVVESTIDDLCSSLVSNINNNIGNLNFEATYSSGTVQILGPISIGPRMDNFKIAVSVSGTITIAYDDTSHDGSVYIAGADNQNGLNFDSPKDGAMLSPAEDVFYLSKPTSDIWKGKNGYGPATVAQDTLFSGITHGQTYTAGWGRICSTSGDAGLVEANSINKYVRIDFSIGSANADCIMLPSPTFLVDTSGTGIESNINSFLLKLNKKIG